jgi:DNA-binding NarL/FixJ family response regulator
MVEAPNGTEAMAVLSTRAFDLVLLDISLPGKNGLEILKDIKASYPQLPVLILTMHPEEQYSTRAIRAGAAGYLSKSGPPELLLTAMRDAMSGGRFITPKVAELLAAELSFDSSRPLHEQLSGREYEVFIGIGRGETVGELAQCLSLSVKTISTYRTRVLEKMGLRNNAEIAQYAIRNKLVD